MGLVEDHVETQTRMLVSVARQIVSEPMTLYGYSDVGDTLVRFLRGNVSFSEALDRLEALQVDYTRDRENHVRRPTDSMPGL